MTNIQPHAMGPDKRDQSATRQSHADWYLHIKGETKGPFDERLLAEMLTSGLIEPETPVARSGDTGWQPALSVVQTAPPPVNPSRPSETKGEKPESLPSMILYLLGCLSSKGSKTVLLCAVALVAVLVVSSLLGDSSGSEGNPPRAGDDRFWADQAERLAQEATGGSNHCARCGGTGQIANSGRATNWNAQPDPSERLRAGADPYRCGSCSGQGTIRTQSGHVVACPDCAGKGQASSRVCDGCGGSGRWR